MKYLAFLPKPSTLSRGWRSASLCAALAFLGMWSSPLDAAYPPPEDDHVNDFAQILGEDSETRLRARLSQVLATRDLAAVVVTIDSIEDYDVGVASIEEFATGLFNHWGIGERGRERGALLLVATADRRMRIEVGSAYGHSQDMAMKRVIDQVIVPKFKEGRFARGIEEGARAMVDGLAPPAAGTGSGHHGATGQNSHHGAFVAETGQRRNSKPESPWALIATAVGLLFSSGFGLRYYLRRRARSCPECSHGLRLLDEAEEDEILDDAQQAEENVGSVDYDVWFCDACGEHLVIRYGKLFSRMGQCPTCHSRTVEKSKRVTARPTRFQEGERAITRRCLHCDWSQTRYQWLPKIADYSGDNDDSGWSFTSGSGSSSGGGFGGGSSSGGSFGGGSSSGGGASGSW